MGDEELRVRAAQHDDARHRRDPLQLTDEPGEVPEHRRVEQVHRWVVEGDPGDAVRLVDPQRLAVVQELVGVMGLILPCPQVSGVFRPRRASLPTSR